MVSPRLHTRRTDAKKAGADVGRNRRRPTTGYRGIELAKSETKDPMKPRERLLGAAYDLAATLRGEQIIGGAKKPLARLHWIFRLRLCQFDSPITRCWPAPISAHVRAGFFHISPAGVQAR